MNNQRTEPSTSVFTRFPDEHAGETRDLPARARALEYPPTVNGTAGFAPTCSAGFGRFPASIVPENWFYAGVDLLVLLVIARDLLSVRRVHVVFLIALPTLVAVHLTAIYSFVTAAPRWMAIAHKLLA